MSRPDLSAVPEWYHGYVNLVPEESLGDALAAHEAGLSPLLRALTPEKWDFRYAAGKWSVKEVIQHIIDCERIFCYRALAFAREERASLPGFDENNYAAASRADSRIPADLLEELQAVQRGSILLFKSFDAAALASSGVANNNRVSVQAIGYILVGHARHHCNVLTERYLQK